MPFTGVWLLSLTVALGYYIHSCQKMRYKGNYRPQYILGKRNSESINQAFSHVRHFEVTNHPRADPESYTWDPLDGELTEKLEKRPYVSLSRDRSSSGTEESKSTPSTGSDANEEELSLFTLNMPGVLTLEETKALKLENWYLLYHGTFVQMSVSLRSTSTAMLS